MKSDFKLDLERSRREGFEVALGVPVCKGKALQVSGHQETAMALSNPVKLSEFSQVEICGLKGAPSLFVSTRSLIDNPQLMVGYHIDGIPLLLGLNRACEAHISLFGQTRSGKTTEASSLVTQTVRAGIPTAVIGCKDLDGMFLGPMRAACDELTRADESGEPCRATFRFCTLRSNTPTYGFNYFSQEKYDQPAWMMTAEILKAFGQDGGQKDPVRRYYTGAAQELFQRTPWGNSSRQFFANIQKQKLDDETKRSTAGVVHEVSQLAAIEHLNFPPDHPANIDLVSLFENKGCVYFDPCFMETGAIATAVAGLAASAVVSAARKVNANRVARGRKKTKFMLVIDEAQCFPISFLGQLISQCASSQVVLVIIYHNLSQLGDEWESIVNTGVRLIFSAVSSSTTEKYLQSLFGTQKEYITTYSDSVGKNQSSGVTHTSGRGGDSISMSDSRGETEGSGMSFQEKDDYAWKLNDTLALNYDKDLFAASVTPGAELAYWGPKAILAQRGGLHMPFKEIDRYAELALAEAAAALPSPQPILYLPAPPPLSQEMMEKRKQCEAVLASAASKIRKEFMAQ